MRHRRPELPPVRLVLLSWGAAERDERRLGLLRERCSLHGGAGDDEGAGRRVNPLAVELEHGAALQDEVELLVPARLILIVLVDNPVADALPGPSVGTERRDAEVAANRAPGAAPVTLLRDVIELRDRVVAHLTPFGRRLGSLRV